ncbi:NAD-dependent epimerase/dehydratase family protein [Streptococcus sp. CSL10205-OR2]|uniref:NAD-dependent epimerase/dehydratase family protein n=1 Tax=Streptococcus sp. CSL10205-OR2 TaxID=2980558 RepID=UPI0021DAC74E|nr:NAD(P)-dependent oxidoreductase [Streptococcus sp. CSL10205-OR2]MCU9533613.1 NAD(P)-dependent oxidoreductase [Streptococcus sp. CSL10205-OR2]
MKVLVTGANGFLGVGIVKQLLDENIDVIATDFKLDHVDERATKVASNLFEVKDPYNAFGQPDVVLHLAWKDGFVHNADSHLLKLPNHHTFLKKLFESDVKKIAVLGTMHEIGFHEGSVDENSACQPLSLYGIAKNALRLDAEYLDKLYHKKLQWLRGFYIVNNTEHGSSIFSKIVQSVKNGDKEFPFTMGLNQFDFLDYPEFCQQVTAAILQDDILGTINICSGRPEKLADRVERFISENHFDIRLQYGTFPDRPYDSKAIWGNNQKITQIMANKVKQ